MDIFIIGSKGIPAKYGGFETFVDQLVSRKKSKQINYHVACLAEDNGEFYYRETHCFNVKVLSIGSAKAILYDIMSLRYCIKYIKEHHIKNSIVYVLACRIGPFIGYYKKKLAQLNVPLFVNPDGHEWLRGKWPKPVKMYWKISEKYMVKHADLLICDSKAIERYIHTDYKKFNPNTTYISYGSDISHTTFYDKNKQQIVNWLNKYHLKPKSYYLIVGRFVPENNYELIIKEFIKTKTKKALLIISNIERNSFYDNLLKKTHFNADDRIKFVGTVYDKELLREIRENAFAYFHGHEVGGTNPSLLEALSTTPLNLLLEVEFNKEVAQKGALYFSKQSGSLEKLINTCEIMPADGIKALQRVAKKRIDDHYSWEYIISKYESLFNSYQTAEEDLNKHKVMTI